MHPPEKRKPARDVDRLSTETMKVKSSHAILSGAMAIPFQWLREGARLIGEAQRSQLARDWRAATIHLLGILTRLEGRAL